MERTYDWKHIENLPELSWIPDRYDIDEKMLFRSPLLLINHIMWNQLIDYRFYNEINSGGDSVITVHAYYTASVHHLRKLIEVEIPANEPFNEEIVVKNFSRLREGSIHQARLENCLVEEDSAQLKNYLENMHRIPDLSQYAPEEMAEIKIQGDGSVESYDRVLVVWAIDLVLGLYREDLEGNVSIVGCSDYLVDFATEIYPKSNNYWIDRIREETVTPRLQFNNGQPGQYRSQISPTSPSKKS